MTLTRKTLPASLALVGLVVNLSEAQTASKSAFTKNTSANIFTNTSHEISGTAKKD